MRQGRFASFARSFVFFYPVVLFAIGVLIHCVRGTGMVLGNRITLWESWVHVSMLAINLSAIYLLLSRNRWGRVFRAVCLSIFVVAQVSWALLGYGGLSREGVVAIVLVVPAVGFLLKFKRIFLDPASPVDGAAPQ